jgi:hypothetical protein
MKSISLTLTTMLSLLTASDAFVSHPTTTRTAAFAVVTPAAARKQSSSSTRSSSMSNKKLFLTPDQATDLEACAYDLMKEALLEAKSKQHHVDVYNKLTQQNNAASTTTEEGHSLAGPVRWCRNRLLAFTGGKVDQNTSTSTSGKLLKNKLRASEKEIGATPSFQEQQAPLHW